MRSSKRSMALLVLGLGQDQQCYPGHPGPRPGPVWALLTVFPHWRLSLTPCRAHGVIQKSRAGILGEPHGAYGFSVTHSPWTEANCSTLGHQQSPSGGTVGLSHGCDLLCQASPMCPDKQWYCLGLQHPLQWGDSKRLYIVWPTLGTQNSYPTPFTGSEPHIRQSSQVNCTHILLVDSCSALSSSPCNQCPLLPLISMVSLVL